MSKVLSYDVGYEVPYGDRDEIYSGFKLIEKKENYDVIFLERGVKDVWNIPGRIEKNDFFNLTKDKLKNNNLIDFHVPNSFLNRKLDFDEIYNQIYKYYIEL